MAAGMATHMATGMATGSTVHVHRCLVRAGWHHTAQRATASSYWLLATGYWLLATGYWLLATSCHSLQKYRNLLPRTARTAQDSPGPPGTAQLPSTCTTNSRKGQKVWRSDPDCLGVGAVKAAWGLPAADWAMPSVKASKVFS
ncbi:uncharacterized protein K441DRAFT_729081 [Cenococcum geophilum 1.58]|uniref:uncharacterized protein n=1 Tax=Cenococcum geophilum 1.58 TaxID=794803 RepID=UPI0035901E2A|nr:hypothetical protein K441DRAFT_729081 [Cenococcum geophilum 1.58]